MPHWRERFLFATPNGPNVFRAFLPQNTKLGYHLTGLPVCSSGKHHVVISLLMSTFDVIHDYACPMLVPSSLVPLAPSWVSGLLRVSSSGRLSGAGLIESGLDRLPVVPLVKASH